MLAVSAVFLFLFPAGRGQAGKAFLLLNDAKIEDTETGLEWAVDAGAPSFGNCAGGRKTWQESVEYVECLNVNEYLGHRDWRLPSPHELSGLISRLAHEYKIERKSQIAAPKLKELGFRNIQPSLYWSSVASGEAAMAVEVLTTGESHPVGKLNALYVWPVRSGR